MTCIWTTYRGTDTIGEPPLTWSQRVQRLLLRQHRSKHEQKALKHPVRKYFRITPHQIKKNPTAESGIEPGIHCSVSNEMTELSGLIYFISNKLRFILLSYVFTSMFQMNFFLSLKGCSFNILCNLYIRFFKSNIVFRLRKLVLIQHARYHPTCLFFPPIFLKNSLMPTLSWSFLLFSLQRNPRKYLCMLFLLIHSICQKSNPRPHSQQSVMLTPRPMT